MHVQLLLPERRIIGKKTANACTCLTPETTVAKFTVAQVTIDLVLTSSAVLAGGAGTLIYVWEKYIINRNVNIHKKS